MALIYEPKGKAREYSPLALNIYAGCAHGCDYCYVPQILYITRDEFLHRKGTKKTFDFAQLEREAKKMAGSYRPVFLSFTSDPYPEEDEQTGLTRKVIEVLRDNRIAVIVLSKSGRRQRRDYDLFQSFNGRIKVGATLTFSGIDSIKHEPHAAMPQERMQILKEMHDLGIMTWASIEPVIIPSQSLAMIKQTLPFVDEYRVGKVNGDKALEESIDWKAFAQDASEILRSAGKSFYLKEDLVKASGLTFPREEIDLALWDTFLEEKREPVQAALF